MAYKNNVPLKLFTLSAEESNCPFIPQICELGISLHQQFFKQKKESETLISMSYGKRVIINTPAHPINHLSRDAFIEIVDYDPIKNILLYIGPAKPHSLTPLHWLIHHAKPQITSLVFLQTIEQSVQIPQTMYETVQQGRTILDTAKTVLKSLQNKPIIYIQETGVLITGETIDKIKERVLRDMR
jgi:hypothetical protein